MRNILETERLILREFTTKDASFIVELLNTDDWLKYIGQRNIKTVEQAAEYILNGPVKSYEINGFGLWLVALKSIKQPIGMCGIIKRTNLTTPDIGFAFLPKFYNQGYAYEAAHATLKFAKEQLHLHSICAITIPENKRSVHLLNKLGLKFKKTFKFPESEQELELFS